ERWDALYHQSMTAAFACAAMSMSARVGQSDRAFLAGMLHDVGKPIALRSLAALHQAGRIDARVIEGGVDAVLERVHVRVGSSMTITWSLPEYLRAVAGQHHEEAPVGDPELHVVRVVDGLACERAGALDDAGRAAMAFSARALRLDERRLRVAATELEGLAAKVSEIFKVTDP